MKKLLWLAAPLVLALGVMAGGTTGFAASSAAPPAPPGQGDCSHGNTGKDCKPDPSTNGKDCDIHGNNGVGGVNEDHCLVATTPATTTDETTTNQTTTNQTTDETTTNQTTTSGTTTNKTTTTPVTTTATDESSTTSQTTTTAAPGTTTSAGHSSGTLSASAPPAAKPQLQRELAKQAAKAGTGRVSAEHITSGQLPFTGFPVWILALVASATLVAGFGIRRLAA
jgi:cobalamin biosynthesis Mg chelatase CobN